MSFVSRTQSRTIQPSVRDINQRSVFYIIDSLVCFKFKPCTRLWILTTAFPVIQSFGVFENLLQWP